MDVIPMAPTPLLMVAVSVRGQGERWLEADYFDDQLEALAYADQALRAGHDVLMEVVRPWRTQQQRCG